MDAEKASFILRHTKQRVWKVFELFISDNPNLTEGEAATIDSELEQVLCDFRRQLTEIPGDLVCPVCRFRLHRRVLRADTGQVYIDASPVENELCPNDGAIMQPMTFKDDLEETSRLALDLMKQLRAAQMRLDELEKVN